ncbi:hypothetical protein SAMN05880573_108122 [Chryseobacterium sp. RU33C]|nr:hypothetical protein SAMN05880573_108122 [Chryseobacterium sp. RU33C]
MKSVPLVRDKISIHLVQAILYAEFYDFYMK